MSMFESCPGSHEGDPLCSIDPGVQVHRTVWTRYCQMYCFEQLYICIDEASGFRVYRLVIRVYVE